MPIEKYDQSVQLQDTARAVLRQAVALANHANILEAAGLDTHMAEAKEAGIALPDIDPSAAPANLKDISALVTRANEWFDQAQIIRIV